jgi:hypothetical protein
MTDESLNRKPAGPLSLEKAAFERDARIPEKNDGKPVDEAEWIRTADATKERIFARQNAFFDELKRRSES